MEWWLGSEKRVPTVTNIAVTNEDVGSLRVGYCYDPTLTKYGIGWWLISQGVPSSFKLAFGSEFYTWAYGKIWTYYGLGSYHISGGDGGGGTVNFDDEPPLLEELGNNTKQIWNKTDSILNPFRVKSDLHEDAVLSGPFLFLMAFGLFQLLAGKLHFGIILGWVTVASLFLYVVFNMLVGRNGNLDLYRCLSLIGYCMLPIVILSAVALFVPQGGIVIFVMMRVFVIWST